MLLKKKKGDKMSKPKEYQDKWVVYLLECSDGTYYCGVTNNIYWRLEEHNEGEGAKYTRGRTPVDLIAISPRMSRSSALQMEILVKKQKKENKIIPFVSIWRLKMLEIETLNEQLDRLGCWKIRDLFKNGKVEFL